MQLISQMRRACGAIAAAGMLSACTGPASEVDTFAGPPISDIVTRFDEALYCLDGRIQDSISFAVGAIPDQTGRDQNSSEGTGRFVTQGAGDIVQSALFNAGVFLVNRRDMGAAAMEAQWGIRDLAMQRTADFVVTGSINSLDFLPGYGATATVGGVGPRYRQNRILIGMDLALTHVGTGRIVANIALRKQLVADEMGFMVARAVGDQLVDIDFGGSRREALHFALREMLQLATFELLSQLMPAERYEDCRQIVDETLAVIDGDRTSGGQIRQLQEARANAEEAAETEAETLGNEVSRSVANASSMELSLMQEGGDAQSGHSFGAEEGTISPAAPAEPSLTREEVTSGITTAGLTPEALSELNRRIAPSPSDDVDSLRPIPRPAGVNIVVPG